MKTVIIDRQKWTRGYRRSGLSPTPACVGKFIGNAFTPEACRQWYATPEFHALAQHPMVFDIIRLNDDEILTEDERERQLIEVCAPMGYALTFIN